MSPADIHQGRLSLPQARGGAGTRSLWARLTQSFFAVLCVVVASLAGGVAAGNLPLQADAASGKLPSADAPRDYGRNLLRPNAGIVAERSPARAIDAGGADPDANPGSVLPTWQDPLSRPGDEVDPPANDERGPVWLTVAAAYPRAPPMVIGRSRTFA